MIDRKIELLAPTGDMECLYAAVNNGADAVYLGGSKFSARAYAKNFTLEDIAEAIDYCHGYGVKVYITINTLIKEKELWEALDYVKELYKIGVDGVIIQDIGLGNKLLNSFPGLEVHASTQMSVHNKSTSLLLRELGIKRIVLARELSLEEVKEISSVIETEVFIHGALCVCYSGQCLMSSMIGGRSGNRGRCAQPCRLPYEIIDKERGERKQGYLLSPKDICTISNINEIIDNGVTSFKIEGRLKKPEYVAGVVASYRKVIDEYIQNKRIVDSSKEETKLLQLFNREGFSRGYFWGNTGRDMMAYNYPKNTGLLLGKAIDGKLVELYSDVHNGDGIRVGDNGTTVSKITIKGRELTSANKGDKVQLWPTIYKKGDLVYKTNDIKLNEKIRESYREKYNRKIPISIAVEFSLGKPILISTIFKGKEYCYEGALVEKPLKNPLSKDFIEDKLRKTGNTPFEIEKISFIKYEEGYISVASINEARRNLLNMLISQQSGEAKVKEINEAYNISSWKGYNSGKKQLDIPEQLYVVSSNEQLKALEEVGVSSVAIDITSRYIDRRKALNCNIPNIYLKLPNIARAEEQSIIRYVEENMSRIKGIITANLGLINYFYDKIPCIGDYKLNIFNSEGLHFMNKYCALSTLSVELNRSEIKDIIKVLPKDLPVQVMVYGKIELMVSEYCAVGSVLGGRSKDSNCKLNCTGAYTLKDRKGMEFVIRNDIYCRSHIYNSLPLDLIDYVKDLKDIGVTHFRYDFIDEGYEETYNIAKAIMNNQSIGLANFTRGHYKRGVE
ncbi:MAG: U32 family peptidase [Clostridiales bacterium]|nr:U32 family peptidase [Clostridiales bacterium]